MVLNFAWIKKRADLRFGTLFLTSSILAIFISCLAKKDKGSGHPLTERGSDR